MRYKVTCSYDGKTYAGFQSQKNGPAIQDELERALKQILREEIRIVMSSRTDAGVHAKGQVFHFDTDQILDPYKLKFSFNSVLPKDIHINEIKKVSDRFHARYSSVSKTYEYLINIGEYDVFLRGRAYQCFYDLDLEKMKEACTYFVGTHDFSSFSTSTYEEKPDQRRTISECRMIRKGDLLAIRITGDGFLRNMVRIIVGTLIDLGRGKRTLEDVRAMIDHPSKTTRRYNIDPNGLYLVKIRYK